MAIDFNVKDVIHKLLVKFVRAFLPEAKKNFYLKAVHQSELDIHAIASKASVYNVTTPPKVIEEGLSAGIELMYYLAADGFKIKTPLFTLRIRLPGEYDGSETHLPEGVFPEPRLQPNIEFRKYLKERVKVVFDGIDQQEGHIAEAVDEATGLADEVMTIGNILTIHGYGLKIESDEDKKAESGVFFCPDTGTPVKAEVLAVNEPRTLKALVLAGLAADAAYRIAIYTQSSAKGHSALLKTMREMRSDFTLTAQT